MPSSCRALRIDCRAFTKCVRSLRSTAAATRSAQAFGPALTPMYCCLQIGSTEWPPVQAFDSKNVISAASGNKGKPPGIFLGTLCNSKRQLSDSVFYCPCPCSRLADDISKEVFDL